jgi:hypothetical protein
MPLATKIRIVIPISVMPERGDQFVRPMHSERMTPAIQIHSVPRIAITAPFTNVISETESCAIVNRTTNAARTAMYNMRIGISSRDTTPRLLDASCMLRTALTINGNARATPVIAPPMSIPIPVGRKRLRHM